MMQKFKLIWPALIALAYVASACDAYRDQERFNEKVYERFGLKHNTTRKQLGIPLLPVKNWKPSRVVVAGDVGECDFVKIGKIEDFSARHERKVINFYLQSGRPIRETDTYYSGRTFIEDDPDSFGWERIEVNYDYVSDSIANIYPNLQENSFTHVFKKGRRQAFLVGPSPLIAIGAANLDKYQYNLIRLVRDTISLAQADSVLISWGIKK